MEMSLPCFAVAKLFWNDSHQKTLGRAGKLGHLHEQGCAFFREVSSIRQWGVETKELKHVALFIQDRGYIHLSKMNKMLWGAGANRVKAQTWQWPEYIAAMEKRSENLPLRAYICPNIHISAAFCRRSHYTVWLGSYAAANADTKGLVHYAWDRGVQLVRGNKKWWHPPC